MGEDEIEEELLFGGELGVDEPIDVLRKSNQEDRSV